MDLHWEDDEQDSFYVDESVLKLFIPAPPYSCKDRVMTEDEVIEWQKGKRIRGESYIA